MYELEPSHTANTSAPFPSNASSDETPLSAEAFPTRQSLKEPGVLATAASFGLELKSLTPEVLHILALAKEFDPLVRKLQLPVAQEIRRDNQTVRVEREVPRQIPKTRYVSGERSVATPSDQLDFTELTASEQLRQLTPSGWLIEEEAPELFAKMVQNRELLRTDWRETTDEPRTSFETVLAKELVEEPAPPLVNRPHAYVLIDTSGSMGEYHLGRDVTAKGLALAFLKYAHEQRATLYVRPFTESTGRLHSGESQEDFFQVVRSIVRVPSDGGTDIQQALATAVRDITRTGSKTPADVLLLSDGLSKLRSNPLGRVRLHTMHIGSGFDFAWDGDKDLNTLKAWSTTYQTIPGRPVPTNIAVECLKELEELRQEIVKRWEETANIAKKLALYENLDQARELLERLVPQATPRSPHYNLVTNFQATLNKFARELQGLGVEFAEGTPIPPQSQTTSSASDAEPQSAPSLPSPPTAEYQKLDGNSLLDELENRPTSLWKWLRQKLRSIFS